MYECSARGVGSSSGMAKRQQMVHALICMWLGHGDNGLYQIRIEGSFHGACIQAHGMHASSCYIV